MKFGTSLPLVQQMPGTPAWQTGDDVSTIVAVAQRADRLGYAWLPCSDHVVVPDSASHSMGTVWYDPATTLAFVAGLTSRIRLLTHVLVLPYHAPLEAAKQYATLDRLSGGRLILGVGTGHLRSEFRALGAAFERRGNVTDERITLIKEIWARGSARTEAGTVHLAPTPAQRPGPSIWVGGNTRRAARRAAELADGWVPWRVTPATIRDCTAYLRELPSFSERTEPFEICAPVGPVDITPAPLDAERAPFAGSLEQVIDDVCAYQAAGVTGLTINFASRSLDDHLERMELFARDVMPAFA
jgi:probable F420-dependent oxidoreductase